MLFRLLMWGLIIYLLFGFIKNVLYPIIVGVNNFNKAAKNMQDKFQNMQEEMKTTTEKSETKKEPTGDYIEFEEVKK